MKKGFTLIELIVVVIIIGILAMIALPQFFKVTERGRAAEGVTLLGAIKNSQIRYALESTNNTSSNSMADLDVEVPNNLKYFDNSTISLSAVNIKTNPGDVIAEITRLGDGYVLKISGNGNLTCTDGSAIACPKMPSQ